MTAQEIAERYRQSQDPQKDAKLEALCRRTGVRLEAVKVLLEAK